MISFILILILNCDRWQPVFQKNAKSDHAYIKMAHENVTKLQGKHLIYQCHGKYDAKR